MREWPSAGVTRRPRVIDATPWASLSRRERAKRAIRVEPRPVLTATVAEACVARQIARLVRSSEDAT